MTCFFHPLTQFNEAHRNRKKKVWKISSEVYYADRGDGMKRSAITAEDPCQVSLLFNRAAKDKEAA